MRVFVFFILVAVISFAGGIIADRVEPTKGLISQHAAPLIEQIIGPPKPAPAQDLPLRLADGESRLSAAELAAYGIESCFPKRALPPEEDRPWLNWSHQTAGVFDRGALPPAPDLADYPGLIKIEGIRTESGTEREHCAAVRVSEHWFLTAAHCILDLNYEAGQPTIDVIAITPFEDLTDEATEVVPLTGAICHSAYGTSRRQYPNDIALFYLRDVSAFEPVEIARLETPEHELIPFDFRRAHIAGWGKNGATRYLQGGPVTIVEAGEAVLIGERIGPRGPNVGDSGAPLYVTREDGPLVVGTLSQVTQDRNENGLRSVYVRTKTMQDWSTRARTICEQNGRYVCRPNIPATPEDANGSESVAASP